MVMYLCAAATDIGRSKRRNEDSIAVGDAEIDGGPTVVAVADGLGGYPGGDIASSLAVEAILDAGPHQSPTALAEAAHTGIRRHILRPLRATLR